MNQTMQMFGQMMCLPMTAWEMMMRSMQGGMMPASCAPQSCTPAWGASCAPAKEALVCAEAESKDWECAPVKCCGTSCRCDGKACHSDCPCRDRIYHNEGDKVKLIEYTLARVTNCHGSRVLDHGQMLVSECTSEQEVQNEIIVRYVNEHCRHHEHGHHEHGHHEHGHHGHDCGPVDGKDLRVYTKVLDCWCKPGFDYEEAQICALQGIERALKGHTVHKPC